MYGWEIHSYTTIRSYCFYPLFVIATQSPYSFVCPTNPCSFCMICIPLPWLANLGAFVTNCVVISSSTNNLQLYFISMIVCYTKESVRLYAMNPSYHIRQNNHIRTYLSFNQRTHHEIICRLDVTFKKPKSTWLQKPWITQVGCIWNDLTIDQ